MNALHATLLGLVDTEPSSELRWLDLPPAWVVILVVLPALFGLAWLSYRSEVFTTAMRSLLVGLRFVAFLLVAAVLARPVLVTSQEEVLPPELLVLVDDSASMRREDAYANDEAARAAIGRLGLPVDATRAEIAHAVWERGLAKTLDERGYEVRLLAFDRETRLVEGLDDLDARGDATHVGDALSSALARHRGRNPVGVLLLGDGRSNGGIDPLDAARGAATAGLPVCSVVIGDTRPLKNAVLELVESPASALEGDEISFAVRVQGRGSAIGERVEVLLEEIDERGDRTLHDSRDVELEAGGRRVVLVAPPGPADPATGERRFEITVPQLDGETLVDDNRVRAQVRVSPERVRVLYVEAYPRWEYRRLALDLLKRAEKDIEFQGWLQESSPGFPQEKSPGLPSLEHLPTTREELLDHYDVVILGDVNPYRLFDDPREGEAFVDALVSFVEAGGGVLFQAGEQDDPRAYLGTPLEDLLPVIVDPSEDLFFEQDTTNAFRPVLENAAVPHEIVRLHPDPDVNRRLWEDADGLQGQYWFSPVARAKTSADVLLRHPTAENRYGRRPLLVTGYYPQGRTMFLAFDSTWRWQWDFGPRYFERFWKGAIRWLSLGRLRSGDRRVRLETPRSRYDLDEAVPLEVRLLGPDWLPSDEPEVRVEVEGPDGATRTLVLPAEDGRPGTYTGELEVDRPGSYGAFVELDGRRASTVSFEVVLPSKENQDPTPDPARCLAMAQISGGTSVELGRFGDVLQAFPEGAERREPMSSTLEDAWDRLGVLLAALAVLAAEWLLRKRVELV
ncbi:MAG: hypothetical protein R3F34_17245 [Planctomycetota bacterium]